MNPYVNSTDAYLAQRVLGASPEQQAALIMEAGQLHLGRAIHAMSLNDSASASRSFTRVSEVIMEATLRLNREGGGELVQNLDKLYGWWSRELIAASHTKDLGRLEVVMSPWERSVRPGNNCTRNRPDLPQLPRWPSGIG